MKPSETAMFGLLALMSFIAAFMLPLGDGAMLVTHRGPAVLVAVAILAGGFALSRNESPAFLAVAALAAATASVLLLGDAAIAGQAAEGFWMLVFAAWLFASLGITRLSALELRDTRAARVRDLAVPLAFGGFFVYLVEVFVRGYGVSPILFPAPSSVAARFAGALPMLGEDVWQTFVRGVLSGYAIGCIAGLLVAVLAGAVPFLQRGLLPVANLLASLPIVGLAPIMVMWFGFDWQSKAAVVAILTFFPMLTNAVAGLSSAGKVERDLMRSYGADRRQTMLKLRLPSALPFIFNALKINSTLALIGAIVAEFFGTPVRGMGFRISVEAGRMALDMVWAEVLVAALVGTAFYGLVALAERAMTSWHPSYRT